jgi:hypothetical protein
MAIAFYVTVTFGDTVIEFVAEFEIVYGFLKIGDFAWLDINGCHIFVAIDIAIARMKYLYDLATMAVCHPFPETPLIWEYFGVRRPQRHEHERGDHG